MKKKTLYCISVFTPGGKVKLYRVKSEAPALQLPSGNQNSVSCVPVSPSVTTYSSSELPVSHESREKIHIKQIFDSDGEPLATYLPEFMDTNIG